MSKIKNLNSKQEYDYIFIWSLYLPFCLIMFESVLREMIPESLQSYIHLAVLASAASLVVISAFLWLKCITIPCLAYDIGIAVFIAEYITFMDNRSFIFTYAVNFFCMCLPLFVNAILMNDEAKNTNILLKASYFIFALGEIKFFIKIIGKIIKPLQNLAYDMSYGYGMLIPACFFIYMFWKKKEIRYLYLSIISAFSILILGSRGALACWGIYIIISFFLANILRVYKIAVIIIGLCILLLKDCIAAFLFNYFKKIGFFSRTLWLISKGEFFSHSSGRDTLFDKCAILIKEHPFFGSGIGADIRELGTYPHNLLVELAVHFGIFVSLFAAIGIIILIIVAFKKANDKKLYMFYFCVGFIPMMVSGTYLNNMTFWIYIGYTLNIVLFRQNLNTNSVLVQY